MHASEAHLARHRRTRTSGAAAGGTEAAPKGSMHNPLRQLILEQALHVIEQARPWVDAVARRDRDLAWQTRRALRSVALNLAEGFGSAAGHARLRFESARGSLSDPRAAVRASQTIVARWLDGARRAHRTVIG